MFDIIKFMNKPSDEWYKLKKTKEVIIKYKSSIYSRELKYYINK